MKYTKPLGYLLIGISVLASAGIYTIFPAAPVVFTVLGTLGGYLVAKHARS